MSFCEKYPSYPLSYVLNGAADHESMVWFMATWGMLSEVQSWAFEDVLLRTTGCIDSGLL